MAIDISRETLISFSQAAALLPNRPNIATLHRWRVNGVKNIKLESLRIGGGRFTSLEALSRFSAAVTSAADGIPAAIRSPHQQRRDHEQAEQVLKADGF